MPDKRENIKSRYTEDREIPGAYEGETVTRRRFMVGTTHLAGAGAAMAFTLPALAFALGPVFERRPATWEDVGPITAFNPNSYVPVNFTQTPGIGDVGRTIAYVRRFNPSIDGGQEPRDQYKDYIAISTRCAHLGCPVRYVAAAQRFICPCHGGVYDNLGKVTGGPPVRPLDRFYTRVRTGHLQIGPRYSVNSELQPLRAPRPRRAAGRHRPVPVPGSLLDAETLMPPIKPASKSPARAAPQVAATVAGAAAGGQRQDALKDKVIHDGTEAGTDRRRLGRRAHLAVGRPALAAVPQGAQGARTGSTRSARRRCSRSSTRP